jgi:ribose-phosphate pyrophosphokinase
MRELFYFPEIEEMARAIGSIIDSEPIPIDVHRFPDGESLVRAESRGSQHAIILRSLCHPNEKIFEVLLAADALRRQGVSRIGLVTPYLGYMRQDRVFQPGEALSQHVIAGLLDSAFDEVLTVEAHLHRIQRLSEVFSCRANSVSASVPIAEWLLRQEEPGVVIGPDSESEPWIRSIAGEAKLGWMLASKTRHSDHEVSIDLPELHRDIDRAWIIDDIASSGTTLETLVRILKDRGVKRVGAIIVHALLDDDTASRLDRAGLDRLISTDSILHPSNKISLAPLLAKEIARTSSVLEAS